ncbi:pilus assembly protein TadG-related protein [Oceaniglobus ichthyenteri]|uniref:pilus assembly protein TadG-related protein n=1 Tax=Oceaniglobus ichthyenteri TaxID=2136177 RepID=UPI000D3A1D7B|nr:pilus assembly protein TadG-related protein [Oceaniglobus ichthyenteri]
MIGARFKNAFRTLMVKENGGLSIFALVVLPAILMGIGVAIDLTSLNAQKRHVQARADLAALTAARRFDTAKISRKAAQNTHTRPGVWPFPLLPLDDDQIVFGTLSDDHHFSPTPTQHRLDGTNAVRVTATARPRFFVLGAFLAQDELMIARAATAAVRPRVGFALSNCLLSLNLFRGMLRPIVGAGLDTLCSGHGVRLRGFEFLGAVAAEADILQPGHTTYGDILDARIDASIIIGTALGQTITRRLGDIRLGDLLYLDRELRRTVVGSPLHELELAVSDIVFGSAEILGKRVVDLKLDIDLGPLAAADITVQVSDPRQIVMGAVPGDPDAVARTSQIRLHVNGVRLAGLAELSLIIDVANAAAHLSDDGVACSKAPEQSVAVFSPVEADLLQVSVRARALGLSLGGNTDHMDENGYRYEPVRRSVSFSRADYDHGTAKIFGPTTPGLTASLSNDLRRLIIDIIGDVLPGGLGRLVGGVLGLVGGVVGQLTTPVDQLVVALLDLKLAEARLDLLAIDCNARLAM